MTSSERRCYRLGGMEELTIIDRATTETLIREIRKILGVLFGPRKDDQEIW